MKRKIVIVAAVGVVLLYLAMLFGRDFVYSFFASDVLTYDTEKAYATEEINLLVGDYIVFGSFNAEPIKWRVLNIEEDGTVLIQSDKILCFMAFDKEGSQQSHHVTDDTRKLGSSDWNNSSLRAWLNSDENDGFLSSTNFTDDEERFISENGDKVFLLSKGEIKKYLDSKELVKTATKTAILESQSSYYILPGSGVWYWLSSNPGNNNTGVHTVTSSGGFYKSPAFDVTIGVCPAMHLVSSNVLSTLGDGSSENPYWIGG